MARKLYLLILMALSFQLVAKDDYAQFIKSFPLPPRVLTGAYLEALHGFDYEKNLFDISFHVWWLTKDKGYRPNDIVEIINATSHSIKQSSTSEFDGIHRTQVHYQATILHSWDMTDFPFDRHKLKVYLEDGLAERDQIEFVPDTKNSKYSPAIKTSLNGWNLEDFTLSEEPYVYATNFGNPNDEGSTFSRLVLTIDIKRSGVGEFFTYFLGFFIAVFLSGLVYFLDPSNIDSKLSLVMAAIFGVVGSKYILDSALPIVPNFTLSDSIQVASFIYIIVGCIVITVESGIERADQLAFSRKLNRTAFVITTSAFILYVGYNFLTALNN